MAAKIVITGNLTRDPEMRTLGTQQACTFSVAVHTRFKKEDGSYLSNFYDCTWFGKGGEYFMNKAQKGTSVTVFGEFAQTEYKNKNGETKMSMRITVDNAEAMARVKSAGTSNQAAQPAAHNDADDELPF